MTKLQRMAMGVSAAVAAIGLMTGCSSADGKWRSSESDGERREFGHAAARRAELVTTNRRQPSR
jgi:hypothetical protein